MLLMAMLSPFAVHDACAAPLPALPPETAEFFGLRPDASTRPAVERVLGTPVRAVAEYTFEYRAASGAADIARQHVEYFPETQQIARLDAYLATPLPAAALRAQFGQPVHARQRSDGHREELFFPRLFGLILSADRPDMVVAISYLSPRALADIYVEQANSHQAQQRYADMGPPAANAIQADPDYARGYLVQGLHFYFQKNLDEAMVRFAAATRTRHTPEKKAHAHVWMAIIHQERKQVEQARAALQKALALAPDFGVAHFEWGKFLLTQGQGGPAEAAFTQAIQFNQGAGMRLDIARVYDERKQWDKATQYYKELADWADSPAADRYGAAGKSTIYYRYARSLSQRSRSTIPHVAGETAARVIAVYEKALRLAPQDASILNNLGYEYAQAKRLDKAEQVYRQGLAADPKHVLLNGNLSDVLLELRRFDEARRVAENTLALQLENAWIANWMTMNVARAYAAMRDKDNALAWLRKAAAGGYKASMQDQYLEGGYFREMLSDAELRALLPGAR